MEIGGKWWLLPSLSYAESCEFKIAHGSLVHYVGSNLHTLIIFPRLFSWFVQFDMIVSMIKVFIVIPS
jgi:hypothetical protein